MSLRLRLFVLFGSLTALLVLGQWWLARTLSQDLSGEVGAVAFSVGSSVLTFIEQAPVDVSLAEDDGRGASMNVQVIPPPGKKRDLRVEVQAGTGGRTVRRVWEGNELVEETKFDRRSHRVIVRRDPTREPLVGSAPSGDRPPVPVPSLVAEGGTWRELSEEIEGVHFQGRSPGVEDFEGTFEQQFILSLDGIDDKVLRLEGDGALTEIPIPRAGLEERIETYTRNHLLGSLGLLALGLLASAAVAHRVSRPLNTLGTAARRVGEGELGVQAPVPKDREVGAAIVAFNQMSNRLAELDRDARALRSRQHLAELGEVARGLAHSLRNPLNALGLTIEELAGRSRVPDTPDAAQDNELAVGARRQIQRIDRSIRALLVLAAERDGDGAVEEVDVGALVRDVVLEALQDSRGRVGIGVDAPAQGPALRAVPAELRAAIQALVVNAVEASPEGGRVEVSVGEEGGRIRVLVEDRGSGVAESVRPRLFEPHVTSKPEGSGMGLFLAQRITSTRYGGRVALGEREGGGTRAVLEAGNRTEVLPESLAGSDFDEEASS